MRERGRGTTFKEGRAGAGAGVCSHSFCLASLPLARPLEHEDALE